MRVLRAGIDVNISGTVVAAFDLHRQRRWRDKEVGGILMGQVSKDVQTVLVTGLTLPGPYDRGTRTTFHRNGAWAQRLTESEFVASGGRTIYLGEWHTHPAKFAQPSLRDISMIREQFSGNTLCTPYLLLIIVSLTDIYVGLYDGDQLWP